MVSFYGLALGSAADYQREFLSCTVFEHLALAVSAAGGRLFRLSSEQSPVLRPSPDFIHEYIFAVLPPVVCQRAPQFHIGQQGRIQTYIAGTAGYRRHLIRRFPLSHGQ